MLAKRQWSTRLLAVAREGLVALCKERLYFYHLLVVSQLKYANDEEKKCYSLSMNESNIWCFRFDSFEKNLPQRCFAHWLCDIHRKMWWEWRRLLLDGDTMFFFPSSTSLRELSKYKMEFQQGYRPLGSRLKYYRLAYEVRRSPLEINRALCRARRSGKNWLRSALPLLWSSQRTKY